ncbi:hypothetical protein ACX40Y_06015 [Sphingomonas sp. RS6]
MQVDRLLARLILPVALAAPAVASAQEAIATAPTDPVGLFRAVCMGGTAKLTRSNAEPSAYPILPAPAKHAMASAVAPDAAAAASAMAPADDAVSNTIYRIAGGNIYLVVPKAGTDAGPLAESCLVVWLAAGDDYLTARKILLPGETRVPLYQRPDSKPDGATFTTTSSGATTYTLATFGGWMALRSYTPAPPSDPEKAN